MVNKLQFNLHLISSKNKAVNNNIKVVFVNKAFNATLNLNEFIQNERIYLPQNNLSEAIWQLEDSIMLSLKEKIETQSIELATLGNIYRGVTTGYNPAFIISPEQREDIINNDSKSKEIIKPLLQGRNIRRWVLND